MTAIPEPIMQAALNCLRESMWRPTTEEAARAIMAAVQAEREACAVLAEERHEHWRMPHPDDAKPGEVCCDVTACADIATAIRRRG